MCRRLFTIALLSALTFDGCDQAARSKLAGGSNESNPSTKRDSEGDEGRLAVLPDGVKAKSANPLRWRFTPEDAVNPDIVLGPAIVLSGAGIVPKPGDKIKIAVRAGLDPTKLSKIYLLVILRMDKPESTDPKDWEGDTNNLRYVTLTEFTIEQGDDRKFYVVINASDVELFDAVGYIVSDRYPVPEYRPLSVASYFYASGPDVNQLSLIDSTWEFETIKTLENNGSDPAKVTDLDAVSSRTGAANVVVAYTYPWNGGTKVITRSGEGHAWSDTSGPNGMGGFKLATYEEGDRTKVLMGFRTSISSSVKLNRQIANLGSSFGNAVEIPIQMLAEISAGHALGVSPDFRTLLSYTYNGKTYYISAPTPDGTYSDESAYANACDSPGSVINVLPVASASYGSHHLSIVLCGGGSNNNELLFRWDGTTMTRSNVMSMLGVNRDGTRLAIDGHGLGHVVTSIRNSETGLYALKYTSETSRGEWSGLYDLEADVELERLDSVAIAIDPKLLTRYIAYVANSAVVMWSSPDGETWTKVNAAEGDYTVKPARSVFAIH